MMQENLFSRALEKSVPFVKGSATSKRAAEEYTPRRAGSDAFAVLAFLYKRGDIGATDREIFTSMPRSQLKLEGTLRRARVDLVEAKRLPNGRGLVGALMRCPTHQMTVRGSEFTPACGLCGAQQEPVERKCEATGAMQTVWAITPIGKRFYENKHGV